MSDAILPLRLHCIEHFMLADSRASHPMSFFIGLGIADVVQLPRMQRALIASCRLHPLLAACIGRHRGCLCWRLGAAEPELSHHRFGDFTRSRQDWNLDLRRQAGLRLSVALGPESSELWLQVHHSCCDARGALDYVRDLQNAYGQLKPGGHAAFAPQQPADQPRPASTRRSARSLQGTSRLRNHLPLQDIQPLPQATRLLQGRALGFSSGPADYVRPGGEKWPRIISYYGRRTVALAATRTSDAANSIPGSERTAKSGGQGGFLPTHVSRSLPLCSSYWHRKRATLPVPATLNDVLLYAMFRSLAHHQKQYDAKGRDAWLRIAMPMDMRSGQERLEPASNRSSLVFLDRKPSQIADAAELLRGVYRETQHIKRHRLGCVFFDCLAVAKQVPLGLQLAVHDRRCAVSAIVSNLGVCEFPSLAGTVKHVQFLPPLRPGTAVALGVATCLQKLQLALHYDHRLLTLTDAAAMLDRVVDDLLPLLKPME